MTTAATSAVNDLLTSPEDVRRFTIASFPWEVGAPDAVWFRVAAEDEWSEWNELPFGVGTGGCVDRRAGIALDCVVEDATQAEPRPCRSPGGIRRPTLPRIRSWCCAMSEGGNTGDRNRTPQ